MTRALNAGQLLEDIVADLRGYDRLRGRLDTSDLGGVTDITPTTDQVYPAQTIQDTDDFPVGVALTVVPGAGQNEGSATSGTFRVDAVCYARLNWRQAIDNDSDRGVSSAEMERVLDAVEERANIAFGIDYLQFDGRTGGASGLEPQQGAQWASARRWEVTRRVFGADGPRSN